MEIIDGFRQFGASLSVIATYGHIRKKADKVGLTLVALDDIAPPALALVARLYRNQWIVDCPDCCNAEFVWIDTPIFMCSNCFNGTVPGRKWRRVDLPADRQEIEITIKARPLPQTRNWSPGETIADLKRENIERGLPKEV